MNRNDRSIVGPTWSLVILLLILAAGFLLRLAYSHGLWGTDDAEYARLANAMAGGHFIDYIRINFIESFTGPIHIPYRTGMIFPLSVLFGLFGVSEATLSLYPFIISMLMILLAFACGTLMFGRGAGLIAAAFWAFMPNDIIRSSAYLPDIPSSFYGSLGITIVIFFLYSGARKRASLLAGGVAAGLIFGVSWLSKESVIYLVPFTLILLYMMLKKDYRSGVTFTSGLAAASISVIIVEMIAYQAIYGDFMSHFHSTEKSYEQTRSYLFYEGSRFGWPVGGSRMKALVKRLFMSGPEVIFLNPLFLFLPAFGLVAWGRSFYKKSGRSFNLAGLWMITLAFMYNFMSCSTKTYTPLVLSDRYLHPIIFPASILVGGFIISLVSSRTDGETADARKERLFWGATISIILVLIVALGTFRLARNLGEYKTAYEIKNAVSMIEPTDRLYTDPLSMKSIEFIWKYPDETNMVDFEDMGPEDVSPGSYVLVDRFRIDWLKVNVDMWLTRVYGYNEPEFASSAPPDWKVLWRGKYSTLYRAE